MAYVSVDKKQLNFHSPCAVYKHVPDAVLNSNSPLSPPLIKLNFSRTVNSFVKDSKINSISQRSGPSCRIILSLRFSGNYDITAGINIGP